MRLHLSSATNASPAPARDSRAGGAVSKIVELRRLENLPARGEDLGNARSALSIWLASFRSPNTRRAYEKEIQAFASFCGAEVDEAASWLLTRTEAEAHNAVDIWRADKLARGNAPATINRSMAALNSFVTSARRGGFTTLRLEAKGEKSASYRDTAGPGLDAVLKMLAVARHQPNRHKAARDVCILQLAFGLALRRAEIAALDVGDVDLEAGRLSILGKGHAERIFLTLTPEIKAALAEWLAFRKCQEPMAPLFVSVSRSRRDGRLTADGIYRLIRHDLGGMAGVKARPHGIRHTAITEALNRVGGDFRKVRAFSRHSSLDIIRAYDDARADYGGEIAAILTSLTRG